MSFSIRFQGGLFPNNIKIRDHTDSEEEVEVRRVFVHPYFSHPRSYNDISISELGKF